MKLRAGVAPFLFGAVGAWAPARAGSDDGSGACAATTDWPGWEGVRHAFVFGDSYTTTGFQHKQHPFPSPSLPLGNPGYPGRTSSNGPNWIDLLTVRHNASVLLTYNLAVSGAAVDTDLVPGISVPSLKVQVREHFLPTYAAAPPWTGSHEDGDGNSDGDGDPVPAWRPSSTVFLMWIGINDVNGSFRRGGGGADELGRLYRAIMAMYGALLHDLHAAAGARNFVLLTVPPVDRSPLTRTGGADAVAAQRLAVEMFNGLVRRMASAFVEDVAVGGGEDGGANVWVYDTHEMFTTVMDDPAAFPETERYQNVDDYCEAYARGTPTPDTYYPECGIPADAYLWNDGFHPTGPIHDVVARQIARALQAGRPNVCPRRDLVSYWDGLALRYGGNGGGGGRYYSDTLGSAGSALQRLMGLAMGPWIGGDL